MPATFENKEGTALKGERMLKLIAKRGILPLMGKITEEKLAELRKWLVVMQLGGKKEATFVIDTEGGDLEQTMYFADTVALLPLVLTGIVVGRCHSAGMTMLQACAKRLATPHSQFFLHSGSHGFRYSFRGDEEAVIRRFRTRFKETKRLCEANIAFIAKRTELSPTRVLEFMKDGDENDRFLSADEALEFNFIDEIVVDFKLPLYRLPVRTRPLGRVFLLAYLHDLPIFSFQKFPSPTRFLHNLSRIVPNGS